MAKRSVISHITHNVISVSLNSNPLGRLFLAILDMLHRRFSKTRNEKHTILDDASQDWITMTKRLNAPEFEQSTDIVDPIMIFPILQRVE